MIGKLTASIVNEYQEKKDKVRTVGEFKALGKELCDRFGLSESEAIEILNNKNVVDILERYEGD